MSGLTWINKRKMIVAECRRRGIKIEQFGKAVRLLGHGVDVIVADLSWVNVADLDGAVDKQAPGRR